MHTRKLTADDWATYKNLRLEALKLHPDVFGTSLEEATAYTNEDWQSFLSAPNSAFFGLFDEDIMVGSSGIFMQDPATKTGMLIGGYIREQYRGKGYSRMLYQERIEWARQSGFFDRIVVGHKKGNEASRRANQAFGFQYIGEVDYTFGDGKRSINLQYELRFR